MTYLVTHHKVCRRMWIVCVQTASELLEPQSLLLTLRNVWEWAGIVVVLPTASEPNPVFCSRQSYLLYVVIGTIVPLLRVTRKVRG